MLVNNLSQNILVIIAIPSTFNLHINYILGIHCFYRQNIEFANFTCCIFEQLKVGTFKEITEMTVLKALSTTDTLLFQVCTESVAQVGLLK